MKTTIIFFVLSVVVVSCSNSSNSARSDDNAVNEEHNSSFSSELSYDYIIEQRHHCFCPPIMSPLKIGGTEDITIIGSDDWVRLYVENEAIVKAENVADGYELTSGQWGRYKSLKELEDMLTQIDTAKDTVSVTVDPVDGYPTAIEIEARPTVNEHGDTVGVLMDAFDDYYNRNYSKAE